MSDPARAPSVPSHSAERPLHKLPDDAIPAEELTLSDELLSAEDSVAALAWMRGAGPKPCLDDEKSG